jgi:organic hydroperoxide reductase OsmC/OhrA
MSAKEHKYSIHLKWTGNLGEGTKKYNAYTRNHEIKGEDKPLILGSSDPAFRGDPTRYNPEDLFVSTLSSCHMLWYLHLCSVNQITVMSYEDNPQGIMVENKDGSGHFKSVTLQPSIKIKESNKIELAKSLHHQAHKYCFIANSVNFEVGIEGNIEIDEQA